MQVRKIEIFSPVSLEKIGERGGIVYVDPAKLLTPDRLDIVVKVIYARFLLANVQSYSDSDPESLYESHIIARTGGVEPNAFYKKVTVADYKQHYCLLIRQIKENGFDESEPIVVSSRTGMVLNGAHRLAASIACGLNCIPVVYDTNAVGRRWDFDWFVRHGFSRRELREIALNYLELDRDHCNIALVWPSQQISPSRILDYLSRKGEVFYFEKLPLQAGVDEFIYDVYSYDKGVAVHARAENISEKAHRLHARRGDVLLVAFRSADFDSTLALRDSLRSYFGSQLNDGPTFDLIHCPSTLGELDHLINIVFSPSTMSSYARRNSLSDNLVCKLEGLMLWMSQEGVSASDACVVGGAVLDLFGYKHCDDVDLVLPYVVRRRFCGSESRNVYEGIDIVGFNYSKKGCKNWWSDDELIFYKDLFVVARGVKFADLSIIIERKRVGGRAKDAHDLRIVAEKDHGRFLDEEELLNYEVLAKKLSSEELMDNAQKEHLDGRLHLASSYYRALLHHDENNVVARMGLATCALQRGDIHEARRLFALVLGSGSEAGSVRKLLNYYIENL